jgi:hypothetical protein
VLCVLALAAPALAQDDESQPLLPSQPIGLEPASIPIDSKSWQDLDVWVNDYTKWKAWFDKWQAENERDWAGSPVAAEVKPDPPEWLSQACATVAEDLDVLGPACRLLRSWRDDLPTAKRRLEIERDRAMQEKLKKSIWWEHLHLDGLWTITDNGGGLYGVVGVHATIDLTNRLEIFIAPGAILLRLPTDTSHEFRPATDLGFSVRLGTFPLLGGRNATLHLNVVKAWIPWGPHDVFSGSIQLAGFSMTFKAR